MDRATVRPPTPESKMPMGASFTAPSLANGPDARGAPGHVEPHFTLGRPRRPRAFAGNATGRPRPNGQDRPTTKGLRGYRLSPATSATHQTQDEADDENGHTDPHEERAHPGETDDHEDDTDDQNQK